jgi:molybdopterin-binding protein
MHKKTPRTAIPSRSVPVMDNMVRIGAAAAALGLSVDTLRRWERDGRIAFERQGGQRYLRAEDLARLLRERTSHDHTSARNRLTGVVVAVQRDGVMAQVDLACGPYRVVSLMSREAVDDLDLKPGMAATAVIKATNVIVERG